MTYRFNDYQNNATWAILILFFEEGVVQILQKNSCKAFAKEKKKANKESNKAGKYLATNWKNLFKALSPEQTRREKTAYLLLPLENEMLKTSSYLLEAIVALNKLKFMTCFFSNRFRLCFE